eukprot:2976483-Pyramimonas_sp.AAC.1
MQLQLKNQKPGACNAPVIAQSCYKGVLQLPTRGPAATYAIPAAHRTARIDTESLRVVFPMALPGDA